jgi:hypothetical protein
MGDIELMIRFALVLLLCMPSFASGALTGPSERPREFWRGLIASNFDVPAGETPFDLLVEMNVLLASPDPVLRDDVAYGAAVRWVYRKRLLTAAEQTRLVQMWSANLTKGLRDGRTEDAYRRSFSALNLSVLAALDNEAPFLSSGEFARLMSDALVYLEAEPDRRGYDPAAGWLHATAHTADLLKFLARSPRLTKDEQARLLEAVTKLCTASPAFTWGEDERLAQVLRSLVRRTDLDMPMFDTWLAGWPAAHALLWKEAPRIDPDRFAAIQNVKTMLRAAYVALAADQDLPPPSADGRQRILQMLTKMR